MNIRGLGNIANPPSIETGVAVLRDGLLQAETLGLAVPLFDVADTEVLEGPQSTLVGASSTAGAVEINSVNPNFRGLDGFVDASFGNYTDQKVQGAVNLPATDTLAFRLAFNEETRNSFYRADGASTDLAGPINSINDPGNVRNEDMRLSVLFKPTDNFQVLNKFEFNLLDDSGEAGEPLSPTYTSLFNGLSCGATGPNGSIVCPGAGVVSHSTFYYPTEQPFVLDYGSTNTQDQQLSWKEGLELRYTLPDGTVLRSMSGEQHFDFSHIIWLSYSPYNDGTADNEAGPNDDYHSEQLELISPTNGNVNWLLGAFWFYRDTPVHRNDEKYSAPYDLPENSSVPYLYANGATPGAIEYLDFDSVQRIAAIYGQVNWQFTSTLQLQVGARENWDNNFDVDNPAQGIYLTAGVPPNNKGAPCPNPTPLSAGGSALACINLNGAQRDSVPTGKVNLSWTPAPGQNFYVFYARGYKSGGVNGEVDLPADFAPEYVNDYEMGWKGQLLENHIVTQVGLYYMQYLNMQYPVYNTSQPAYGSQVENLQPSTIKGLEFAMQSRFGHLGFDLGLDYNKSALGALTTLFTQTLPGNSPYGFGTSSAPAQCPASGPVPGCFNYVPYETSVSGEPNPMSPTFTGNLAAEYVFPIGESYTLTPRVTYSYMSSQYWSIFRIPYTYLSPRHLLGANLDFAAGHWLWEVYGTNLADETYVAGSDGSNQYYGAPRQYGARFHYSF